MLSHSPIAPRYRLTDRCLSGFGITDHPLPLPAPTTFWMLSPLPIALKQLSQPTTFWVLSGRLKERVQGIIAEPANGERHRRKTAK